MTGSATSAPAKRSPLPLVVICLGYFLVILDTMVVNVALPAIGTELHGGVSSLQWVVDAYTLAFAGFLLSGGALVERLGARRTFVGSVALFATASLACGCAPSLAVLVGARVLQGAGAAVLVPSSLVLLQAAYTSREERSRAFGAWGSIAGVGAAAGPIVGGLLVTAWSWRGVFLVNLPFALAALVLARGRLPAVERRLRAADAAGQALGVGSLALLTAALVEGGRLGWGSPAVLVGLAAAAITALGFVAAERRHRDPMLPLGLFAEPGFAAGSAVGLFINFGFYGQLFVMSLYFQQTRGYSALGAGLALLPEALLLVAASTMSGRLMARRGPRPAMLAGLSLGAAGLLGLAVAGPHTSYPELVPAMAAAGFGMALTMPAATASVMESAPPERGGIASGVVNAARQTGGVLGVALLGALLHTSRGTVSGLRPGLVVAAGAFAAGVAVTLRLAARQALSPGVAARRAGDG